MTESTSPRAARSREKLLRAATDLLADSGPRAVTVDAVAQRSGVAKSTLYRHWGSRDEMLIDVVRCNIPDVPPADLSRGFRVALGQYMAHAATTLSDPEWSRIVPALMSLRTSMPELQEFVDADRNEKSAVLAAILALGVDEGTMPTGISAELASNMLIGPLLFAALMGQNDGLDDLADHVVDRFIASYRS